jgi:hypothetical protein
MNDQPVVASIVEGDGEVTDQPAFSASLDLDQARRNSRSFRKLCRDWQTHVPADSPATDRSNPIGD